MTKGWWDRASELARETPEDRDRYVDLLRVAALCAVVIGHWLVIHVQPAERPVVGRNALVEVTGAHWLTWIFQVIPLFFLVGGFANLISWRHHRAAGGDWASWLHRRSIRLLWPTVLFVAAGSIGASVAASTGIPEGTLDQAAWAVGFVLWFLAVYVPVTALTPVAIRLHDRWGLAVVVGFAVAVAATDVVRLSGLSDLPAQLNHALVWGAFHQLGFAWRDGMLGGRRPLVLGLGSAAALVAVVLLGPYPVAMVAVPGDPIQNTIPPSVALLLLGFAQTGLVLSLGDRIRPLLRRRRVWTTVVGGNLVVMSVFLWHVVPVVVLSGILAAARVRLPEPIGSVSWFAFRPVWIVTLALLLVPIVLVMSRVEQPPDRLEAPARRWGRSRTALVVGLAGVGASSGGLTRLALEGFWEASTGRIPVWSVSACFAGFLLVWASGLLARGRD